MTKKEKRKFSRAHIWIKGAFGKADHCEKCLKTKTEFPKTHFDWSNKDHEYSPDRKQWQQLCRRCHVQYDVRFNGRNSLTEAASE